MKYLVNVLVLLTSFIPALASAQWFEIEVAVFSRPDLSNEHWAAEQKPFEQRPTLTLANSRQAGGAYRLNSSQLKLGSKVNQINGLPGHQVLAHQGWRMSVRGRGSAIPVAIIGGKDLTGILPSPQPVQAFGDNTENEFNAPIAPTSGQRIWQLDGWLNIWLSHYLYVEAQLDLKQQAMRVPFVESLATDNTEADVNALVPDSALAKSSPQAQATEPYWQIIPMRQTRRMRSNEVHYLDHPKMGVIIQIRRF